MLEKSMNFFGGVGGKAGEAAEKTGGFFGGMLTGGVNIFKGLHK